MLTNININKLFPHPKNPRKDLGDLAELADSIKSRGVMQNLTVVPKGKGTYTVIIGHRRLAASKLTGLETVPCVIAEMDEKDQVSTMLLENMQRSDLTVIEQAQGFQMMLDLGETAKTISEKTGFSETTVKKRLFVASLDAKKSKAAQDRGATLFDYMKLQQLTDEKNRNKVLESLGTHNFDYQLRQAVSEELRDRVAPQIIKQIDGFAKPTDKQSWELRGYSTDWNKRCNYEDFEKTGKIKFAIPKKFNPDEYLYHITTSGVEIYKKDENFKPDKKMADLPPEEQEKRRENRRKYKTLKEMGETAYQLRLDFVKAFSQKAMPTAEQFAAMAKFAFAAVCLGDGLEYDKYAKIAEIEKFKHDYAYSARKDGLNMRGDPPAKILLMSLFSMFRDNGENVYYLGSEAQAEVRGQHKKNDRLDAIYDCLLALGYQMSDDEQALRDGTHDMFIKVSA